MPTTKVTSPAHRFYGKAQDVAEQIVRAFQEPQRLPAALAPIFIHRRDNVPCRAWSWANQLLVAIHGHSDARGSRQWQQVKRNVRQGEHSFLILSPVTRRVADKETEEERIVAVGFRATPVFGYAQTEGEPLPIDLQHDGWIRCLPLRDVAAQWNINVDTFNGRDGGPLGSFAPGNIALGVKNLSTWCHELVHAADHRNGSLTELGQHWRSEVVAELGGAVLLRAMGHDADADLGGCWEYVSAYAEQAGIQPVTACQRVLKRACDAVALILDTAEHLNCPPSPHR